MKKVVGYTALKTYLQETDESSILCIDSHHIVHLGHIGLVRPECGLDINAYRKEVMYFNGGQKIEKFCPKCFLQYQGLLEKLSVERPDA